MARDRIAPPEVLEWPHGPVTLRESRPDALAREFNPDTVG
jgi:hypothetical protein